MKCALYSFWLPRSATLWYRSCQLRSYPPSTGLIANRRMVLRISECVPVGTHYEYRNKGNFNCVQNKHKTIVL
jgi:hypothetical protein